MTNIETWAAQKNLNPTLVIRPTSVHSPSKAVAYLYTTSLDSATYGHGFSSASARDVLINISSLDKFEFEAHSGLVTIRTGQTWANVCPTLGQMAPEYGSKTPQQDRYAPGSWLSPHKKSLVCVRPVLE